MPPGGEAILTPTFAPLDPPAPALSAPSLRLKADPPTWRPLVSEPPSPRPAQQNEAILRLNAPAVRSLSAIFDADGGPPRSDFRRLAEAFLGRISAADFVATIHTRKHMTESGNISKATRSAPLTELVGDRQWAKLFDADTDYQTVTVEIAHPNAPYPLVGFVMQAGLRGVSELPGQPRPAPLNGAIWSLEDARVEGELGLGGDALDRLFDEWVEGVAPIQAWRARAAWIPEFDTYEDTMPTLYEQARTPDWVHPAGTKPAKVSALVGRRLRFVTPRLWLGHGFAAAVDRADLERVALVSTRGATLRIELRPEFGLRDLEQVLAPIL